MQAFVESVDELEP